MDVNCVCHYRVVIMHWITSSKCIILNLKWNIIEEYEHFDLRNNINLLCLSKCSVEHLILFRWLNKGKSWTECAYNLSDQINLYSWWNILTPIVWNICYHCLSQLLVQEVVNKLYLSLRWLVLVVNLWVHFPYRRSFWIR